MEKVILHKPDGLVHDEDVLHHGLDDQEEHKVDFSTYWDCFATKDLVCKWFDIRGGLSILLSMIYNNLGSLEKRITFYTPQNFEYL